MHSREGCAENQPICVSVCKESCLRHTQSQSLRSNTSPFPLKFMDFILRKNSSAVRNVQLVSSQVVWDLAVQRETSG